MLFNNISNIENIITIDLKVSFKKLNLIITKDKSHEIQISKEQNYQSLTIIK